MVIPDSITSIRTQAFSGCTGLTDITIGTGVRSIAYGVFSWCTGLTNLAVPAGVTSIGGYAFEGCTGLTDLAIASGVRSIGSGTFSGCIGLTDITIPDSVTSIGDRAFDKTTWYNNQPDGLVYAGKVAYEYKGTMPADTVIELNPGTLGIGGYAFHDCTGLTNITIPDSVISIGGGALDATTWYNNQPDGLVYAGKVAYTYKGAMPTGTVPEFSPGTLGIANSAFEDFSNLTSITFPDSLTSIGDRAFAYCSRLINITIPNSVTSIGDDAFYSCSGLTNIIIPDSVTSIGAEAFNRCDNLTIIANPDSYAERYANENDIHFLSLNDNILSSAPGSDCVVNNKLNYIYGLTAGITVAGLEEVTQIPVDCSIEYSTNTLVTGTQINIIDDTTGTIIDTFTIIIFGDVNGDGLISAADALITLKNASESVTLNDAERFAGDVDMSDDIWSDDALQILQFASGIITEFEISGGLS